ncbi:flavin-containing monooxygenase FMO GS-OX-like 8 [Panicum miliaceum]|uniref:Flavin-containing monooxygenase FMO GS-OX-like 8 n=1 Tax=Panicum miliaceum TaxID=4540 RepID=A0A3L6Q9L2_PANMI|nr:flavin-containing monooxygenase FMO GS-OX-like 8 [Panicum miliaceum]
MTRSAEEYHLIRVREMGGVPRRLSYAIFFDIEYCDEFGFPGMPEWKRELMSSTVKCFKEDDAEWYLPRQRCCPRGIAL